METFINVTYPRNLADFLVSNSVWWGFLILAYFDFLFEDFVHTLSSD